ncbi:MAG TPA: hypothetical protein ENJ53_06345 [Phaeodactylibacter sp.]|nr:hypothetical protein [Phaeodactylibacter sp.]
MTKDEFIKTGLCELYILGLADEEETALVEEMLEKYPELKKDCQGVEKCIGNYARKSDKIPHWCLKKSLAQKKDTIQFVFMAIVFMLTVSLLFFYFFT